ncbi:MAG: hypothetical protein KGK07_15990 [Chloroflexota bacterium]|nr:hypothetical protein [Chloroflexota bacterium]
MVEASDEDRLILAAAVRVAANMKLDGKRFVAGIQRGEDNAPDVLIIQNERGVSQLTIPVDDFKRLLAEAAQKEEAAKAGRRLPNRRERRALVSRSR